MTEATSACIRGCALRRRHLTDCDGTTDDTCRGCLPRRAEYGRLCWPCHRRFELMLHDAPIAYRWLTGSMSKTSGGIDPNGRVTGGGDEAPAPLNVDILDVRDLLADRLACWVDDLAEDRNLTGPDTHTVAADAKWLRMWLTTVERLEWVDDWFDELAETLVSAHALAPWRPHGPKRVSGIPCPECAEVNLMIYAGESDVTCRSCGMIILEKHFALWEQIIADEQEAAG